MLLLPEEWNERERIGDPDEAEDTLCRVGEHLDERGAETVPCEENER